MGKSTASCFKIITCGSDSAGKDDDLELAQVFDIGLVFLLVLFFFFNLLVLMIEYANAY